MILQPPKNVVAKHPFAEIPMGPFVAINNMWGDQGGVFLKQSVRTTEDGKTVRLRWDIKPEAPGAVMGFPNITCGKHPWSPESTTKELPVRLGDVKRIPVTLDYKLGRRGKCNAVLDCWITSGPPHGPADIVMEAMIWLEARGGMTPYGNRDDAAGTPDLWSGKIVAPHYQFPVVSKIFMGLIHLDLKAMLLIMAHGRIDLDSCYLSAIELGAECVAGNGWMNVNRFDVEVVR